MEYLIAEGLIHINGTLLWIAAIAVITIGPIRNCKKQRKDSQGQSEARIFIMLLIATVLAGSTGLFFLYELEIWNQVPGGGFWWIHSMVLAWILFSLVFFLVDPLISESTE